uniref:Diaphanous-related formin 3 n=1 Tax=Paramormyrops kingsleyae TaxID=1676925 RepID=A0A3B3RXB1_9TELE
MENYHQRCESAGKGREKSYRKKGFIGGVGAFSYGGPGHEDGDRKPKFFDRFASIRKPGTKKERSYLSQVTPSVLEDFSCQITSENEILVLFEKMMEDMNLNEDKKTPLREKDLNVKREMVIQYIGNTGSLKSSHQISPQEFLSELKTGTVDERLFACLESLRVSLTSNPVSWVQSFGHEGLGLLLDTLEKLQHKHQGRIIKKSQHKVIQCLKAFMNNKVWVCRAHPAFHLLIPSTHNCGKAKSVLHLL